MKGTWTQYTAKQLTWIRAHRKMARRALHQAFVKRFKRKDVTKDNIKALCTRRGWKTGRTGCFPKGSVPANKGQKMPFNPNSAKTQFKKGQRSHTTKHVGYEYVSKKDGYTYLCIDEVNPHTGFEHRFVMKHKHLWEKINGPVPADHCLKSKDGNRLNTDPGNWELVPRSMLPRLAGRWGVPYDSAPAELKPTLFAIAKLETKARAIRKGNHPAKEK